MRVKTRWLFACHLSRKPEPAREDVVEKRIGRLAHFHPHGRHPPALRVFGDPVGRSTVLQLVNAVPELQPQARGPVTIVEYAMRKGRVHGTVREDRLTSRPAARPRGGHRRSPAGQAPGIEFVCRARAQ